MEDESRQLILPFAVAGIKCNILDTASLKNIHKTLPSKTLLYHLNTNEKYSQTIPTLHHSHLKLLVLLVQKLKLF